ncbi:MAG TPA: fatty acid desaturase [Pyrinomonadaceae bacterium]|jgi:stearoyl-CoA desaturase (delta-9 desaturase)
MGNEAIIQDQAKRINWDTAIFMVLFHLGAVAALFMFKWQALLVTLLLWWISASLGAGMGFHRLLTHRAYKTPKLVEYFLSICGTLALEGGPINWVVTHRIHHAHTDAPGDPHSPRDGGWWAHMGWILKGKAQHHDNEAMARYAPDLVKDRFHVWLNRYYWLPLVVVGLLLLAFGGWSYLMWAIFFRVTFNLHATWLVNSATHMWGTRRFATRDDSTNNWWVALLTFGEGWHNNHHAHPTAARHGLAWYEIDLNWWGIRTLQSLRLAKAIKLVSVAERTGA